MRQFEEPTFITHWTKQLVVNANDGIDKLITEGLIRKGYHFENRLDLLDFIRISCRCEDNKGENEKIFFVNNVPFLLYRYNNSPNMETVQTASGWKVTIDMGEYCFL